MGKPNEKRLQKLRSVAEDLQRFTAEDDPFHCVQEKSLDSMTKAELIEEVERLRQSSQIMYEAMLAARTSNAFPVPWEQAIALAQLVFHDLGREWANAGANFYATNLCKVCGSSRKFIAGAKRIYELLNIKERDNHFNNGYNRKETTDESGKGTLEDVRLLDPKPSDVDAGTTEEESEEVPDGQSQNLGDSAPS